jgi:hypothetical protein
MNKEVVDRDVAPKEGEEDEADGEDDSSTSGDNDTVDDETDAEPETPPPPIELPNRTTRGRRLRQVRSRLAHLSWACK